MKPKYKVLSMKVVNEPIRKNVMGYFAQVVTYKAEGLEKEAVDTISSRKKKDLPQSIEWMRRRIEKGTMEIEVNQVGQVDCLSYPLF
jgi:hypothetical protein